MSLSNVEYVLVKYLRAFYCFEFYNIFQLEILFVHTKFSSIGLGVIGFILHLFQVDMDMEDDMGDVLPPVQGREAEKVVDPTVEEDASRVL